MRACEADFKLAFTNLTAAVELFTDQDKTKSSGIFHFNTNKDDIKKAVGDIGFAFRDVAHGVSDCHLAELAQLLADLAEKLGIAPELQWVEELLKILIDGVEVENEIADACQDYSEGNWVGFGYNLARLIKTLVSSDLTEAQATILRGSVQPRGVLPVQVRLALQ